MDNRSIRFFDMQFQQQVAKHDFALNPFEELALRHVHGSVLDLGCGLGNFTLAAARQGHPVVAVDASHTAIERIRSAASAEKLAVEAVEADISTWRPDQDFDSLVAIGVLMFLEHERATQTLETLLRHVRPGGIAIINVLIVGTTFMDMFDPSGWCLFDQDDVLRRLDGWTTVESRYDSFVAPGGTRKVFSTVVAARPA